MLGCLLLVYMHLWQGAAAAPTREGPAKPSVTVSYERQTVREDDAVGVNLWIANDSDRELTDAEVHIAAPDFFEWREGGCEGGRLAGPLRLGTIHARSVVDRRLCLRTNPVIRVGDFNTLFTLSYKWEAGGGRGVHASGRTCRGSSSRRAATGR